MCDAQTHISSLTSYSVEDGLSSRFVTDIYEDSRGYVWLGTQRGLNRFDGENFKLYFDEKNDKFQPCIYNIIEDVDGNIWPSFVAKEKNNSLYVWDKIITKDFEIVDIDEYFEGKIPFKASEIKYTYQTEKGDVYFLLTSGYFYKYNGKFELLHTLLKGEYLNLLSVTEDGQPCLFSETHFMLAQVPNGDVEILKWRGKEESRQILHIYKNEILWFNYFIVVDKIKASFLERENGKAVFLKDVDKIIPFLTDMKGFRVLPKTEEGELFFYLIANQFLAKVDINGNLIRNYTDDLLKINPDLYIGSLHFLKDGRIWMTNNDGFSIFESKINQFKHYLEGTPLISTRMINAIDEDKLLVNTYRDVFELDITTGVATPLNLVSYTYGATILPNGHYLIGMHGQNIIDYNPLTKKFVNYSSNLSKDPFGDRNPTYLIPFCDKHRNIWIGTEKGLYYLDKEDKFLKPFAKYNEYEQLESIFIKSFYEDKEGIWLLTTRGLFLLDVDEGIIDAPKELSTYMLNDVYREGDYFWLATGGDGLIRWDKNTKRIKQYATRHGFLDNRVTAVIPDEQGHLWLPTYKGLTRFDKETESVHTFLESDGISHEEFNDNSHFKHRDGRIFIGGLNGITAFDPEKISINTTPNAPFMITAYTEVDGTSGELMDKTAYLFEKDRIDLEPSIKSFSIHFALLNFMNTDKTRYSYRIKGFDENWNQQTEDYVRINGLPFGAYTLELKALDYAGNWSDTINIPIEVKAPFYRKPIWQLLAICMLFLLIYLGSQWRIRALKKQTEKLEYEVENRIKVINEQRIELSHLNETKDRIFAILAHDLRNPVIAFEDLVKSINYLLQSDQPERVLELGNYIEKEAVQLHHLLDNLLNWALAQREELPIIPTSLPLNLIIKDIIQSNGILAERNGVKIINELDSEITIFADRRVLDTVFRNLISNAVRYIEDPSGWIKISAQKTKDNIKITITDNGIGMTTSEVARLFQINSTTKQKGDNVTISLGLLLCRELIELLNGTITAESKKGVGTSFFIELPLAP